MNRRTRRGFTLIELLVVITIIGMLMALLMPAVQSARESARQAQCRNRQRQIALAAQQFEATYRYFPGYANTVADKPVSWVVTLFPYLGENDLWKRWREGEQRRVYRELFICPSDPPEQTGAGATPLAYVVNCGREDIRNASPPDKMANGVFHDLREKSGVRVSLDYLASKDGAQKTLLLSETVRPQKSTSGTPQPHSWAEYLYGTDVTSLEAQVGFTWKTAGGKNINQDLEFDYPRPASHHGGGVIATFCDGHVEFLREDIDYYVYVHLMTPYGEGSDYANLFPAGKEVVDDADY